MLKSLLCDDLLRITLARKMLSTCGLCQMNPQKLLNQIILLKHWNFKYLFIVRNSYFKQYTSSPQHEVLILVEILAQTYVRTRANKVRTSLRMICIMYYQLINCILPYNGNNPRKKMFANWQLFLIHEKTFANGDNPS